MNTRLQSTLVVVGTLIIGMVLGALLWSNIVTRRNEQIEGLRRAERWQSFIEEAIQPTDEEQRKAIQAVVEENNQAFIRILGQMRSIGDSLQIKLAPILNDEQEERLKKVLGGRYMRRGGRGRGGERSRPNMRSHKEGGPQSMHLVPDSLLTDEQRATLAEQRQRKSDIQSQSPARP